MAVAGMQIPIYGDGKNVRDWLHVDDHCRAIECILHKGKSGEIYNIGAGNEINNLELAKQILSILQRDENLISFVKDRKGHDRRYSVNVSKIITLGWKTKMPFDKVLRETITWYKSNIK